MRGCVCERRDERRDNAGREPNQIKRHRQRDRQKSQKRLKKSKKKRKEKKRVRDRKKGGGWESSTSTSTSSRTAGQTQRRSPGKPVDVCLGSLGFFFKQRNSQEEPWYGRRGKKAINR